MSLLGNVILMLVIGAIVGWLASSVAKVNAKREVLLGAGLAGSILGVAVAYVMDFGPYGLLGSTIACIAGSGLSIAVLDSLGVFGKVASAR